MWKEVLLKSMDRRKVEVTFNPHLFDRKDYWNLDSNKIEETVRFGKIFEQKSERPNKICFKRYFGKENMTYTVIVRFYENFIEVKTVWPNKGK